MNAVARATWVARRSGAYVTVALRGARWREYEGYLRWARATGIALVPVEEWLLAPDSYDGRVLVMRHDVDQDPISAREMCAVERELGVRSTFYFRWSTFDHRVVSRVRATGCSVGLHYETLTRYAIDRGITFPDGITPAVIDDCRETLRAEIARFRELAGVCDSVAAHGDRRAHLIGVTNRVLLEGERYEDYGLRASADDPFARQRLDHWVADGNGAPRWWVGEISLKDAIESEFKAVMFNSHPHHWRAGAPVVAKRVSLNVAGLIRSPSRFTWGSPESLAWNRYRRYT